MDHEFSCKQNNKIPTHNFLRDWTAEAIKPTPATAGYISDSAKRLIQSAVISFPATFTSIFWISLLM